MKAIDGKYGTDGTYLYNLVSGEVLPDDEPLFLLRARDRLAVGIILEYLRSCMEDDCTDLHVQGVREVLIKFEHFRREHPERMKQPGITKHLKLDSEK
jgi:hypothetical protein